MAYQRFQRFVTVSAELIDVLKFHPPGHYSVGQEPKTATFVIDGDGMFPVVIKVRPPKGEAPTVEHLPIAGTVYNAVFSFEPSKKFTDGKSGKSCKSRDRWVVRLYPHDYNTTDAFAQGELRLDIFAKGQDEIIIEPVPVWKKVVEGTVQKACLWIAENETTHAISICSVSDKVLWSGCVAVQLDGLKEQRRPGSVRIELEDRDAKVHERRPNFLRGRYLEPTVVYDRRSDRMRSFGRAERIERSLVDERDCVIRTFEFINVRDLDGHNIDEEPPTRLLSADGLVSLEEEAA
jgi:hypothetical protein